jgi:hypothetical protein
LFGFSVNILGWCRRQENIVMSNKIIGEHPTGHPYGISLSAIDKLTSDEVRVQHRILSEKGNRDVFMDFTVNALKFHHFDAETLSRRKHLIESFKIKNLKMPSNLLYPTAEKTQRGNFAEIVLAEYLCASTTATLPVYRLRYNPNPQQSMKGDDVLMFDLDSKPARIIVGEAKFRGVPNKQAVTEIIEGLLRSHKAQLPVSLTFVSDRLFERGNSTLGQRVLDCADLIAADKLNIDYVGFLLSNHNGSRHVDKNTTNELHSLMMISLGVNSPREMVREAFQRLEVDL